MLDDLRYIKRSLGDTDFIDADIEKAEQELEIFSGMITSALCRTLLLPSARMSTAGNTQSFLNVMKS